MARLLVSKGMLVASQRMLGNLLGCSKTAVAATLAALVTVGACETVTTPKGTVVQLAKV